MKTVFVLVKTELGQTYEVANSLLETERISEVYSISGQYDILLKCYIDDKTDIGRFVTESIQTISGIKDTFTLIAFKAFS
ncbi:MAG: Lrp/AsnC ligand binding domain-containing protein [Rhodospirillaceae bacterium]|nr:Lrp/AsnC ligand binding domain-containing protein [Rhodospirillaceae bacterium]